MDPAGSSKGKSTSDLITAASQRLLTKAEKAALVAGLWKGSKAAFAATLSKAYALAKRYDRVGGGDTYNELMDCFASLGESDFGVLYAALDKLRA